MTLANWLGAYHGDRFEAAILQGIKAFHMGVTVVTEV